MKLKNCLIILCLFTLFACSKDNNTGMEQPELIELLSQKWKPQTFQVLENGYDSSVQAIADTDVWGLQSNGMFYLQNCTECNPVLDGS